MNINRIEKIVNRIAKKRIALKDSPYSLDKIWELGRKDPDAQVFLYDDIVTDSIQRGNFPASSHSALSRNLYNENKEEMELKGIYSSTNLYCKVIRGYWLPEMNQVFFHDNPSEEQVSNSLREMNVEIDKEEIYRI